MKKLLRAPLLLIISLSLTLAHAQSYQIPPAPAYKDASLDSFVSHLRSIIARRDTGGLMSLTDPHMKNSFGDDGTDGRRAFRKAWQPGTANTAIWGTLAKLLSYPPSVDTLHRTASFPYLFSLEAPDSIDVSSILYITGRNIRIRQQPLVSSPVLATVSKEVILYRPVVTAIPKCTDKSHAHYYDKLRNRDWIPVSTMDRKVKGFVYGEYAYNPLSYRLFVSKESGAWKMAALVQGD